jgi:hypothetical protein
LKKKLFLLEKKLFLGKKTLKFFFQEYTASTATIARVAPVALPATNEHLPEPQH